MSRFYKIIVGAQTASQIEATGTGSGTASNNAGATWTNMVNGQADLGAQTVEFDIWAVGVDAPAGLSTVKIWGPSIAQIRQSADFNGASIQVFAGMQKGLPLATDAVNSGQQGLIVTGTIFQAFGNWQGINQTLDFVISPTPSGTQSQPANISHLWKKGTPLADVLRQVLQTAYPTFQAPKISISPDLVLGHDEPFVFSTLTQLASYIRGISININPALSPGAVGKYQGVTIYQQGTQFIVTDGTQGDSSAVTSIQAQDLIGQPTWLGIGTMQFSTVMRADLQVGANITFPAIAGATAVTTAQSYSVARDPLTFSGTWQITKVRHVGNSRQPNALAWLTTFEAITIGAAPGAVSVGASSA